MLRIARSFLFRLVTDILSEAGYILAMTQIITHCPIQKILSQIQLSTEGIILNFKDLKVHQLVQL